MMKRISINTIIWIVLSLTISTVPFIPDVKLIRLKLQWLEIGVFSAFSIWMLYYAYKAKITWIISRIHTPVALYTAYIIILYFFSHNKPVAIMEIRRILLCFGIYMVSSQMLTAYEAQRKLIHAWVLSSGLVAVYGILQHFGGFWIIDVPYADRIIGMSGNPIFFAAHLMITIPFICSLAVTSRRVLVKGYLIILMGVIVTAIFYTKTRAAYIAVIIGMVFWLLLWERARGFISITALWQKKWIVVGVLTCTIIAHIIALHIAGPYKKTNDTIINFVVALAHRNQAHAVIWRDTVRMWLSEPIIGKGLGTFAIYFPDYASEKLRAIWPQKQFIINDAHNEYLQILAETGIIGFCLFLWLLFSYSRTLWHKDNIKYQILNIKINNIKLNTKTLDDHYASNSLGIWYAGIAAASLMIIVQNIFSVDMRFVISAAWLFLMMGMTASLSTHYKQYDWLKKPEIRWLGVISTAVCLVFIGNGVISPIIDRTILEKEVDFFDQKILEPAKTIQELKTLAEQYPDKPSVYEKLGWVYAKEQEWDKAIRNYEKAINLNPKLAGAYNNIGNIYFTMGRRNTALPYYLKALEADPNFVDAHMNAGIAYYYQGKLRESAEHIKKVIELDPGNVKARDILKRMVE